MIVDTTVLMTLDNDSNFGTRNKGRSHCGCTVYLQ